MGASALQAFARARRAAFLPDSDKWTHRVRIDSETSRRQYVIAINRGTGQLACSCPGWIHRKHCKHIDALIAAGDSD